jgi:energy-coupling factor transporter ATP-binding protein EcfA2
VSEKLHRLTMRSFRGVPGEMSVDFGEGRSIAVYGDNGTGKSTIADALEWFFTGQIELLSHEGRQHAVRNIGGSQNGETSVELETSGTLGGRVVFPDERGPEAVSVASRETFLLRGRTLADFINKTKTEKWKALAEILGLDAVEELRQDLQRARGDIKKQVKAAKDLVDSFQKVLPPEKELLSELQNICRGLGVDVPDSLDRFADPVWIASVSGETAASPPPSVDAVKASLEQLAPPVLDEEAARAWNDLSAKPGADPSRLSFFRGALAVLSSPDEDGHCPLCGQKADRKELARSVRASVEELEALSREREEALERVRESLEVLQSAAERRASLRARARALGVELPEVPEVPSDLGGAPSFLSALERWDGEAKSAVEAGSEVVADPRQKQLAMLAALGAQIRESRLAERELARKKKALDLAERLFEAYQDRQKEQLETILQSISARVAELYDALHPGENLGTITVEPWTAKGVELAVDFHGSRQRPPHGVLSESHLNSLAIALFLAMAQTFNEKLRFLVLDDVINSFDVEHRGQLATLLAEKFDDWQLIVLTHDHQFFEHLWKRAPTWNRLEITSWSYDDGPRTTRYESGGRLADARERLAGGDANGAATKARRALEELLQEVCENLEAELPFRRGSKNDRRELGELFKGVRRVLKENAKAMHAGLDPLLKNLEADVGATLNVEAHASRGRSGSAEVEAALARIEELDSKWSCPGCETRIWHKGSKESSRCKCGKTVFPPVT